LRRFVREGGVDSSAERIYLGLQPGESQQEETKMAV
jgi:hypothetical protein